MLAAVHVEVVQQRGVESLLQRLHFRVPAGQAVLRRHPRGNFPPGGLEEAARVRRRRQHPSGGRRVQVVQEGSRRSSGGLHRHHSSAAHSGAVAVGP